MGKTIHEILEEIERRISEALKNQDYGKADRIYHNEYKAAQEEAEKLWEVRER